MIVDLIEELEIQLDQEFYAYYKVESPKLRQALPTTAPLKTSRTAALIDKQESTVKSAPVTSTAANSKIKSLPIHVRATTVASSITSLTNGTILQSNQEKCGGNQKSVARSPKKPHTFAFATGNKTESIPIKQSLVSKIMAFQRQPTKFVPKIEKPLKQNGDKVLHDLTLFDKQPSVLIHYSMVFYFPFIYQIIKTVVRDVIKKYRKTATLSVGPSETPTLPSLVETATKVSGQTVSGKNKNRNLPRKYLRQSKNKVLSDITDMYAVGLRLTK